MRFMDSYMFGGGTAVVTGAASGIGAALATALAARGSDLVLVDRDIDRLAAVVTGLGRTRPDVRIDSYLVDLADPAATDELAAEVVQTHSEVTLLVNNAGVALAGRLDQVSLADFDWLMRINFGATVRLTHALLPTLLRHPGSHLVNLSSVFGLAAVPGQTAYCASKFAVRGFTDALRGELAGRPIGVTSIHPGGIRTRIVDNARLGEGLDPADFERSRAQWQRLFRIEAVDAAAAIMTGIERRKRRVLIGATAVLPDLLSRAFPGSYGSILRSAERLTTRR